MKNRKFNVSIKALFLLVMMAFTLASSTFALKESVTTTIFVENSKTIFVTIGDSLKNSPEYNSAQGNAKVSYLNLDKINDVQKIKSNRTTFYWKCNMCDHLERGSLFGMFKMAFHHIGHILNGTPSIEQDS